MKLKVCGLREPQTIEQISRLDIDYIGFHFHKASPAFIGDRISFDFARSLPKHIQKTGVFVDEDLYSILSAVARYDLDVTELHGDAGEAVCRELKPYVKVVKAFGLKEHLDFKILEPYIPHVDYILFERHDGNNTSSDDDTLRHYPYGTPFFLSGTPREASLQAIDKLHGQPLFALNLNLGVEAQTGLTEPEEIAALIHQLHHHTHRG